MRNGIRVENIRPTHPAQGIRHLKWKCREINGNDYHTISSAAWFEITAAIEDCDGDRYYANLYKFGILQESQEFSDFDKAKQWCFHRMIVFTGVEP